MVIATLCSRSQHCWLVSYSNSLCRHTLPPRQRSLFTPSYTHFCVKEGYVPLPEGEKVNDFLPKGDRSLRLCFKLGALSAVMLLHVAHASCRLACAAQPKATMRARVICFDHSMWRGPSRELLYHQQRMTRRQRCSAAQTYISSEWHAKLLE